MGQHENRRTLPLTSLRFFAAAAVVFHHYFGFSFPRAAQGRLLGPLIEYSAISVFFFFILSGYILAYVYLQNRNSFNLRRFYWSRAARIYPLYIFTILVSVPGLYLARQPRWGVHKALIGTAGTLASHSLLLQHWIPQLGALNYPSWSISSEAFFYLVFPVLGVFLWRGSTRRAILIGSTWFLATWLLRGISESHLHVDPFAHILPIFELHLFVIGIVLAKVHLAIQKDPRTSRALNTWGGPLALVTLLAFAALTESHRMMQMTYRHDALSSILFLVLILAFASGNRAIEAIFTASWLVLLGEASFGLYLLHMPVYQLFVFLRMPLSGSFFFLYLAVTILLSVLSFLYFETPARRAILHRTNVHTPESQANASIAQ